MTLIPVRTASAALLAAALAQPLAAQDYQMAPAQPPLDGAGLALGLAAIAALGILLQDDDEEESEQDGRVRALPARCLATWRTSSGAATLYDPDCLARTAPAAGRLPLACAVTVRSAGRFVSGFSPACLRERGWRTPH